MMSHYRKYGSILLAISALLFVGGLLLHFDTPVSERSTYGEAGNVWSRLIVERGAEAAYEEFAERMQGFSENEQHTYAHTFGGVLYEQEGLAAFSICDAQFLYGCVHEFVGKAIASEGMQAAFALNQSCTDTLGDNSLFCQHGIGHGTLAYLGYSESDLQAALSVCKDLPYGDPIGGCYGGVFMEYNMRTMLGDIEGAVRTSENPLTPCDTLEDAYAPACAYWISEWWRAGSLNGFGSDVEVYARMGEYCQDIAGDNDQILEACFRGIGNLLAPEVGYDSQKIRTLCDATSAISREQTLCIGSAASRTAGSPKNHRALRICDTLKGATLSFCVASATGNWEALKDIPL